MKYVKLSFFLLVFLLISCKNNSQESQAPVKHVDLVELNKVWVKKNRQTIIGYLNRQGIKMTETPTGLWFQKISEGNGVEVKQDKLIEISYDIFLLDGTLCYSSLEEGNKTFLVGKGGVESGLEEGILLLHKGDSVHFLIPPYLAHGNTGDDKKIPPRAILDYRIKVVDVLE